MSTPINCTDSELAIFFQGLVEGIQADMLLGHIPVCAVEINTHCQKVIHERQQDNTLPWFPIFDDVKTFDGRPWRGLVDVLQAGFPCKGISPARTNSRDNGELVGLYGASSELYFQVPRIIGEMQPPFVYLENSKHLRTRGLVRILKDFRSMRYDVKWCCIGSRHVRADHDRGRMWIKATNAHGSQLERGGLSSGVHQEYAYLGGSNWGQDKPRLERTANGMDNQMERLKAIGNGQDPRVAALAWRLLSS